VGERNDHYVILYYRAQPLTLDLLPNSSEVIEADWIPADRLAAYDMTPGTRHILAQVYPGMLQDPGEPVDELFYRNESGIIYQ
jgi:8-oxo-dGTP diphosphatase